MAIEFTNLVGDWRRIVEDYVTDPENNADAPGVEGTITVTPVLGEGRHAPRGVPSGGVFYTFAPLDLRVYRGLLRDENMNADITVAIEVDGYPIAWRARFDLQYRRIKIPLQDVIFGPDEIVADQISLSSLVARDGVPPEYEGSYVQLMDAVAQAADHADRAEQAADNVDAAVAGAADVVVQAVESDRIAAELAATDAASSASDAAGSATDADAARAAAVVARTGAETARTGAEGARDAADGHATRAETAADLFDLTATATTGAAGSNAAVTVTGDGPAYGLSFTVPRGDKGDKGDKGAAGAQEVAWTTDGRPYLLDSPDVSGGDSGWRTIDTKNNSGGNPNRLDIRRIGETCYARVYGQPGWANNETITFTGTPAGFKHELGRFHDNTYGCSAPIVTNIGNGQPTDCGRIGYRLWVNEEIQVRITNNGTRYWVAELSWFTTDEWPETLPGTAAE